MSKMFFGGLQMGWGFVLPQKRFLIIPNRIMRLFSRARSSFELRLEPSLKFSIRREWEVWDSREMIIKRPWVCNTPESIRHCPRTRAAQAKGSLLP